MPEATHFRSLIAGPAPDLETTVTAITTFGRPDVDPDEVAAGLDRVAASVDARDADALVAALFGSGRFRGDRVAYHHPDNNLLDRVLVRGLGIPLSLTVVAVLVGRRLGVPLGVAPLPGHILAVADGGALYDVFAGGERLDESGARRLLTTMFAAPVPWDDRHVQPASTLTVVTRWVANLARASASVGDRAGLLRALRLESCLTPLDPSRRLLLATLLERSGAYGEAAHELEAMLADGALGDDADAAALANRAVSLRARLN